MTQKEQNALEFTKALISSAPQITVYADKKQADGVYRPYVEKGFFLAELFEEIREKRRQILTEKQNENNK